MKTIALDISVLNEKNKTGVGVYTHQLIKALLSLNKKDKFILFGVSTLQTYEYLKNIEFKKYPNVELKIFKMPAKFFRRAFLLWQTLNWPKIESLIGPVDILHSFSWNLPPIKKGKMVAGVFDMTPFLFPELHLKKTIQLDKVRLERIKKYADLVITISQNSKEDFLKFAPEKKVEVIYPGIGDIFLDKHTDNSKKILAKYNLKSGFILSVGTIEPRKNLVRLVRTFSLLVNSINRVNEKISNELQLVIAGSKGWLSDEIYKLPKKLRIEDSVKFLGRVEDKDLAELYKNAFCLLYPSFYEGFGIPVLEAQASGCPVITSSVSSLPEAGGKGAIYVDPYSVEEMVEAIKKYQISNFRSQMIKQGFENIKRFSWEESAKKLNFLYQKL